MITYFYVGISRLLGDFWVVYTTANREGDFLQEGPPNLRD